MDQGGFEFFRDTRYFVFIIMTEILFVIDIILMFFTSYRDLKGREETDLDKIANNYVRTSQFYTDALSVLGSSAIS